MENLFETLNEAGGKAIVRTEEQALALYAVTGCLSQTFYASSEMQTRTILDLCDKVNPEMVAKIAIYAREKGHMKEVPALLTVWLYAKKYNDLFVKVFDRVIDNGKMLRNFIKHLNSKITGRKSTGTLAARMVENWFNSRTDSEIFSQSVGDNPSFYGVIKLCHPRPLNNTRNALYRYLTNKQVELNDLPEIVQSFEKYKSKEQKELPNVPFEMLTALNLGQNEWAQIALKAGWHWVRMNLNTLQRHKVFDLPEMTERIVAKLTDIDLIKKSRVFPYQLMTVYKNAVDIPHSVKEALQDALEIATENVPVIKGDGYVLIDVSGSMKNPVTGNRSASTKVMCVDVAGLLASIILRKNPSSTVIPFADRVKEVSLNSRDTVLTNAKKLSDMVNGGTNCAAPLKLLNEKSAKGDWVFLISDNQSWGIGLSRGSFLTKDKQTAFMSEWNAYKSRNPNAKLICLDIVPYITSQVQEREDILMLGGFSDSCFDIVDSFVKDELTSSHWAGIISKVEL